MRGIYTIKTARPMESRWIGIQIPVMVSSRKSVVSSAWISAIGTLGTIPIMSTLGMAILELI